MLGLFLVRHLYKRKRAKRSKCDWLSLHGHGPRYHQRRSDGLVVTETSMLLFRKSPSPLLEVETIEGPTTGSPSTNETVLESSKGNYRPYSFKSLGGALSQIRPFAKLPSTTSRITEPEGRALSPNTGIFLLKETDGTSENAPSLWVFSQTILSSSSPHRRDHQSSRLSRDSHVSQSSEGHWSEQLTPLSSPVVL